MSGRIEQNYVKALQGNNMGEIEAKIEYILSSQAWLIKETSIHQVRNQDGSVSYDALVVFVNK